MNKTPARGRVITVAVAAAVTGLALSGCRAALPPTDPNTAADFTVNQIASVPGAAFTVVGELAGGSSSQEILTSQFAFTFGAQGPVPIPSGLVLNRKSSGTWTQSNVFSASDGSLMVAWAAWDAGYVGFPNGRRLHIGTFTVRNLRPTITER